jgi:hypothetical protein
MSTGALDPLIHNPERLRIIATLAALPGSDTLSGIRLRGSLGLTPGRLFPGEAGKARPQARGRQRPARSRSESSGAA